MSDAAKRFGGNVKFEVVTGDGEDRYDTADSDFFISADMPDRIRRVALRYDDRESHVSLTLELPNSVTGRGELLGESQGASVTYVVGLTSELDRRLRQCLIASKSLTFLHKNKQPSLPTIFLILGVTMSMILGSVSDRLVEYLNQIGSFSSPDDFHAVKLLAFLIVVAAGGFFGGWWTADFTEKLRQAFPRVQFIGAISDPGSQRRPAILHVTKLIAGGLVAVTLSLFASAIYARL
ncbi:MAG: hypothetical protein Q7S58_03200 [Candidatus Binatus sp.]|uniref:hypothetical protein n=1 Tax=Candidatus Binatus sp. TaxID=2811406 RepID=UPI0027186128|nr:hypothetical protein [Candidatus Binatus sp.]MDO8431396.1 hypothetical protein [Candidatus Binatus sp.]